MTAVCSVTPTTGLAEERLRAVPWRSLRRVADELDDPLAEVLAGASAERVVDRTLRRLGPLGREERTAVAEALFGVAVWRLRIAHHLGRRAAAPRIHLALFLRDLCGVRAVEDLVGLPPGALPPEVAPPSDLGGRYSLPPWLAAIVRAEAGYGAAALADALDRPGPVCLRANTLRTSPAALAAGLARAGVETRPGRLVPGALVVTSPHANLHGLEAWREALFEVQDEASQLVAHSVAAAPGERVLDLCAGAGGKTLALACAVGQGGQVHVSDPDAEKLRRLATRARRAGAEAIVRVHGESAPPDLVVDRVLVDAPCSELGALRRGPDRRYRIDPASFSELESLQRDLLSRGASHVRPGGRLVYATCTFRTEEDEAIANGFERAQARFRRAAFVRTWPHRDECDGFFIAAWQLEP